jgi:hypothetical protein
VRLGGRESPWLTKSPTSRNSWRGLEVPKCLYQERIDVSGYADDVPVPYFGPRMVCTKCGTIGADARPNWKSVAREYSILIQSFILFECEKL